MSNVAATVVLAKCGSTQRPFGITVKNFGDPTWHCTWAFKMDLSSAKAEGFDQTSVSGNVVLDETYPGCPHCGNNGWVLCGSCGKLTCYGESKSERCVWCGTSFGNVTSGEKFDLKGGAY